MLIEERESMSVDVEMEDQNSAQRFPEAVVERDVDMVPEEEQSQLQQLPEDLVDKIISMMAYPSVFKARMLSKSWLAKFSPVPMLGDQTEKQHLATSFQKLVGESSSKWDTFCPLRLEKEDSGAYDPASHSWRKNLSLSFLPKHLLAASYKQMQGALLFMCSKPTFGDLLFSPTPIFTEELCVANVLTHTWKMLPPRSNASESRLYRAVIVSPTPSQSYKIIAFSVDSEGLEECCAQIYDPQSDAWSAKVVLEDVEVMRPCVYLDGVLYMLGDMNRLFAINVEDGTSVELDIPVEFNCFEGCTSELVVCNGSLLVVEKENVGPERPISYRLLKIDVRSRKVSEVGRGPPAALKVGEVRTQLVSHGDSVFFGGERFFGRVLAFDVKEGKWSCLPASFGEGYNASAFQPGLNPFVAV